MLDTVMLCGNSNDFADEKPRGPLDAWQATRQLLWLQERLARSKADFLLVVGHYPVWSVSEHGPTECLLQSVHPLLIKHNVTAYFCGHDHNLQVSSAAPRPGCKNTPALCSRLFSVSAVPRGVGGGLRGERRRELPGS